MILTDGTRLSSPSPDIVSGGAPTSSPSSLSPPSNQNNQDPLPDNPVPPPEFCKSQQSQHPPPRLSDFVYNNVGTSTPMCPTSVPSSSPGTCSYPFTYYISNEKFSHAIRLLL